MSNQQILDSFRELSDSFKRLLSYSKNAKEDYEKINVAKRFRMTFDLFIKNLSLILVEYKVNCKFPSDYIRNAAKFGIINNEKVFLQMLEDKYKLTNLSNLKLPDEIYKNIVKYIIILRKYIEKIEEEYISNKKS